MMRLCKRCARRAGIVTKIAAPVEDVFFYDTVVEVVSLCGECRTDASQENAVALSRRTKIGGIRL